MVATIAEQPFSVADTTVSSRSFAISIWLAAILALFASFSGEGGGPSAGIRNRHSPFLSQCLCGGNYSRTLNNPRAIEDGPAEM